MRRQSGNYPRVPRPQYPRGFHYGYYQPYRPGYPLVPPEYLGRDSLCPFDPPPYFNIRPILRNLAIAQLMSTWRVFINRPEIIETFVYQRISLRPNFRPDDPVTTLQMAQQLRDLISRNMQRWGESMYLQLTAPPEDQHPLTTLDEQVFLSLPGFEHQIYMRCMTMLSMSAPLVTPLGSSPPRQSSPLRPPPLFTPLPPRWYPPYRPPPASPPPASDTRASTPEQPLDLSMMEFRDYLEVASESLSAERPLFQHNTHSWTVVHESDNASPVDELLRQRSSPARPSRTPSNSSADSDCFIVSAPENFRPMQCPAGSFQIKGASGDFRPVHSSESTTAFTCGQITSSSSQSRIVYSQPTARSLEQYPSRSLEHTPGSLAGVSMTRKRGHSNEVSSFEPPPKRTTDDLSRRSVITSGHSSRTIPWSEPSTANEHVPYPLYFPSTSSAPSTIQSHTEMKNEAKPTRRSSLRSFKIPNRGSNVRPPAPSPVPTSKPKIWSPIDRPMSPQGHTPMPTPTVSTITTSTRANPQVHYPFSPMHPTMNPTRMPMLPPDYRPLPDPENLPLPRQPREQPACPHCGLTSHSVCNCWMKPKQKPTARKPPRKK